MVSVRHLSSSSKLSRSSLLVDDQERRIDTEIEQLLADIRRVGTIYPDPESRVLFGELFDDDQVQQYYEALVGTLKSAKKRGKIRFKGQMLLKGCHDKVVISIVEEGEEVSTPKLQKYNRGSENSIGSRDDKVITTDLSPKPFPKYSGRDVAPSSTKSHDQGRNGGMRSFDKSWNTPYSRHSSSHLSPTYGSNQDEDSDAETVSSVVTAPSYVTHARGGWKRRQQHTKKSSHEPSFNKFSTTTVDDEGTSKKNSKVRSTETNRKSSATTMKKMITSSAKNLSWSTKTATNKVPAVRQSYGGPGSFQKSASHRHISRLSLSRNPSAEQSARVDTEINQLLKDIRRIGNDGEPHTTFGELFDDEDVQQYYEALVGTLKSAKKRGYIEFKGQMLLKGMHDKVCIMITRD